MLPKEREGNIVPNTVTGTSVLLAVGIMSLRNTPRRDGWRLLSAAGEANREKQTSYWVSPHLPAQLRPGDSST